MKIAVRTFGNLRRYLPDHLQGGWLDLPEGATVGQLLAVLEVPEHEAWRVTLNGQLVELEAVLSDGDEVRLFAPVGGG